VRLEIGTLAATMLLAGAYQATPAAAWQMRGLDGFPAAVRAEINGVRIQHGLARLRQVTPLRRAAEQHVYEMAVLGFFSHASPNRPSLAARLAAFYPWRGFRTWNVGETLLWGQMPRSAGDVVRLWLNSPEHRRKLLDPRFREIGIDAVELSGAGGVFEGHDVLLVAAEFGVRR
jgi:uncharacterized protein YkwD